MREIVVIGAGFAGFHTVKALERGLIGRRRVRVTLINDRAHFLFTPLLPNVANGELKLHSITLPLREHLEETTRFILDRVEHIDLKAGHIKLAQRADTLPFDYLIVAPGAQTNWFGNERWRDHALTCKEAHDATKIHDAIISAYNEASQTSDHARRSQLLTFTLAGGGPSGVELAGELYANIQRRIFPKIDASLRAATRFIIIEPREELLSGLDPELRSRAARALEHQGIELRLGRSVIERDEAHIVLDNNDELSTQNFFWCAGVKAPPLLTQIDGLSLSQDGRVMVNEQLQAIGVGEHVMVLGDSALTPDYAPQSAQSATQQAPAAAYNLLATMSGRTPKAWSLSPQGDLITLGRGQALARAKGVTMEGVAAYALYRLVYASLMPGSLKKLRVLTDWFQGDWQDQDELLQLTEQAL